MSKTTTYRQKSTNELQELVLIPASFDLPPQKHGHHRLFTSFLPLKHAHVAEFYWNLDQNQPIRDCVTVDDIIERAVILGWEAANVAGTAA